MKPSRQAKMLGLKDLKTVTVHTGVSQQTLNNWFYKKPRLFKIVMLGVYYYLLLRGEQGKII